MAQKRASRGRPRELVLGLALAGALVAPGAAGAAGPQAGALRPLPAGIPSCVAGLGGTHPASCTRTPAMGGGNDRLAISPDGRHLYSSYQGHNTIVVLARDGATGAISPAGCVQDQDTQSVPECTQVRGLSGLSDVAVSPDGAHVYATAADEDAVTWFRRDAATGALTFAGCRSSLSNAGGCGAPATAFGATDAHRVTVAPDGAHVYVSTIANDPNVNGTEGTLLVFDRDPQTGALAQEPAPAGCLSAVARPGCTVEAVIEAPRALEVSPDGEHLYVADESANALIVYAIAPGGALTRVACLSSEKPACTAMPDIGGGPRAVAVADDGAHLYLATHADHELFSFERFGNGTLELLACSRTVPTAACPGDLTRSNQPHSLALSRDGNLYFGATGGGGATLTFDVGDDGIAVQKPVPFGCVAAPGTQECIAAPEAGLALDVVVSPDGRHVYAASGNRVVAFDRDDAPACAAVTAQVAPGQSVDVPLACGDPEGDSLSFEILAAPAQGSLNPPDAAGTARYTAPLGAAGVVTFSFRATGFDAHSAPATGTVEIVPPASPPGPAATPTPVPTPPATAIVAGRPQIAGRRRGGAAALTRVRARGVVRGERVSVTCTGRGCPARSRLKSRTARRAGTIDFARAFRGRRLRPGAVVTLRVTRRDFVGRAAVATVRRGGKPAVRQRCIPLNSTRLAACP